MGLTHCGLSHWRVLNFTPVPQVREQEPNGLQAPQLPSRLRMSGVSQMQCPLKQCCKTEGHSYDPLFQGHLDAPYSSVCCSLDVCLALEALEERTPHPLEVQSPVRSPRKMPACPAPLPQLPPRPPTVLHVLSSPLCPLSPSLSHTPHHVSG